MKNKLNLFAITLLSCTISTQVFSAKIKEAENNAPEKIQILNKVDSSILSKKLKKLSEAKPWLDIPASEKLFNKNDKNQVKKIIDAYHNLKKDDLQNFDKRKKMLSKIASICSQTPNDPVLSCYHLCASNKLSYLEIMENLIKNYKGQKKKYFEGGKTNDGLSLLPLHEDYERNSIVDPFNRLVKDKYYPDYKKYLKKYFDKKKKDIPSFWLWMEGKDTSKVVSLCSPDLLPTKTRIKIENGKLFKYGNTKKPYETEGDIVYAMDENKNLYIGGEHHQELINGLPVICAGEIKVQGGKIVSITNDSGHYKPPLPFLKQVVSVLKKKNVLSENISILNCPSKDQKIKISIDDLLGHN